MYKLVFPKNKFTAISGYMGSGMTLTAVAILTEMSRDKDCPNIVANIHLKNIKYELFKEERLFDYKDSIVFLDMACFPFDSRGEGQKMNTDNYGGFINELEENNNTLVFAGHALDYFVAPKIRELYDFFIVPNYNEEKGFVYLKIYHKPDPVIENWEKLKTKFIRNVSQYFGNYDTAEIVNFDFLKARAK